MEMISDMANYPTCKIDAIWGISCSFNSFPSLLQTLAVAREKSRVQKGDLSCTSWILLIILLILGGILETIVIGSHEIIFKISLKAIPLINLLKRSSLRFHHFSFSSQLIYPFKTYSISCILMMSLRDTRACSNSASVLQKANLNKVSRDQKVWKISSIGCKLC